MMAEATKVNISRIESMASGYTNGLMEGFTKATGMLVNRMVTVSIHYAMEHLK